MRASILAVFVIFTAVPAAAQVHLELIDSFKLPAVLFSKPYAISVSQAENVFISDIGNHKVYKFNKAGKMLRQVGGFGWNSEEFDTPSDIDASDNLNVYIADTNNRLIKRFDRELSFLAILGKSDISGPDESGRELGFPASVAVSLQGDLFFSDRENNVVTKIDKFGKSSLSFGNYQQGEGFLSEPGKLAISATEIYVVDIGSSVVRVFDYFGNYLRTIGEDKLNKPGGIAVSKKYVFVVDAGTKKIIVFDKTGKKLGLLTDNELTSPIDISIQFERVFVLSKNQVDIYNIRRL